MKKALSVLLAIAILCTMSTAMAAKPSKSNAKTPVNAFDFTERYAARLVEFQEFLGDDPYKFGIGFPIPVYPTQGSSNLITAACSAGVITFDPANMEIVEWNNIVFVENDGVDKNNDRVVAASAAVSALEYDVTDANLYTISTKMPIAAKGYTEVVESILTNMEKYSNMKDDQQTLFYKGNYSYFVEKTTIMGKRIITLYAK